MSAETGRKLSDLPSGDPALLNRISWARRWNDRKASVDYALAARRKALDGKGRRSRAEQGFSLRTLGWHALWRGDLKLAMDYCLRAETYLPESEFALARAAIYSLIAKIHYNRNRFDLAICSVERGQWLVEEVTHDPATVADLMLTQAAIQRQSGERARAGITLGRAREISSGENAALVDICTAHLLLDDGNAVQAREHAAAALSFCEETNSQVMTPFARSILAGCYSARGMHLDAHDQITTALNSLDKGDHLARCALLRRRAVHHLNKGETEEALGVLGDAARIAENQTFTLSQKQIALKLADVLEEIEDFRGALNQHKLAWKLQNETRVR